MRSQHFIGLPEGELALAEAVPLLTTIGVLAAKSQIWLGQGLPLVPSQTSSITPSGVSPGLPQPICD